MTPEDRDLLFSLRRQQADMQQSLDRLNAQLSALESRAGAVAMDVVLPPMPVDPILPPLPPDHAAPPVTLPPIPTFPDPVAYSLPPIPPPPVRTHSVEFQFGRWLIRSGPVFLLLFILSFLTWANANYDLLHRMGPWGKLGIASIISLSVIILGQRIERTHPRNRFFSRTVLIAGLAGLYVTFYAACSFASVRVVHSPYLAGLLMLWWGAYVLLLADRKKSQVLALFAIALAYFSTALNPYDRFTMAANLALAAAAVFFLLRRGWAVLLFLSLLGTYYALLHRLVVDADGEIILDTSRTLHFLPHAAYLAVTWFLFTAAVLLSTDPSFRGGKRLAFLSLNNGAFTALLVLAVYLCGYSYFSVGDALLSTGLLFLIASRFIGWTAMEPEKAMAAYAAQGLALVTAGIVIVFSGVTRAFLLLMETLFLGAAGAFTADRVLTVTVYFTSFFATLFLVWEIGFHGHHPWLLGFGGAVVMLINAWWARAEIRHSPRSRTTVVPSTVYYCSLAVTLVFTALYGELSESALPPALALAALVLTFLIYWVELYELPSLAQSLLLSAQALVLFPADTGEELPWWSTTFVAAVTLLLLTWWSRQKITRSGPWIVVLTFIYALALVGLAYQTVRPWVDPQGWMVVASLLSVAFLLYGALSRIGPIAAMGQLFLVVAVFIFFRPPEGHGFPWSCWAALVPMAVVFFTARAAKRWLRFSRDATEACRAPLQFFIRAYELLALVMLIRMIFALIVPIDQVTIFLLFGTLVLISNIRPPSTFGVRCSFLLTALGMVLYIENLSANAAAMATFLNAFAVLSFLVQPAVLRREFRPLVTSLESWTLLVFSVGTGWLFVSEWALTRVSSGSLTLGWALYALFLLLFGLVVRDRRLRWCGMAMVIAAILRAGFCDMWHLSNGYRVLTFLLLTIVTFGLGYLTLKFADRRQHWL